MKYGISSFLTDWLFYSLMALAVIVPMLLFVSGFVLLILNASLWISIPYFVLGLAPIVGGMGAWIENN